MAVRQGYKQTDIGVIPDDWEVKKLSQLGNFSKGQGVRKDEALSGNIPCVRYGELYTRHNDYIKNFYSFISKDISLTSKRLRKGDILFAGSGETKEEIGKSVAFVDDFEAYAGGDIVILSPVRCSSLYLGYLLNAPVIQKQKASRGQGDAVVHVSAKQLGNISIPMPPTIEEQTRIAVALTETDALIYKLEKIIEKKRCIKQGTIQKLLLSKTHWKMKTYGEVFSFLNTATYSRAELSDGEAVGYIHYGDIHTKWNSFLDVKRNSLPTISEQQLKSYSLLKNGDVIMADASEDYSGVGKCVEVKNLGKRKVISGLHTFLLRDTKGIFVDGYRGYIYKSSFVKNQFDRLATGMKVYGVSKNNLKTVMIPVPPKEEQVAIAETLSDMDLEISNLENKLEKYKQLKHGMMQQLLTGKIRLI